MCRKTETTLQARGAYLISGHKHFLRDVELEELRVHPVHQGWDDIVYGGGNLTDEFGVARGEVEEVGEVGDAVLERRLDEEGVDLLREDGACRAVVVGVRRGGMERGLRVLGPSGRVGAAGSATSDRARAARKGAHERFMRIKRQARELRFHDGSKNDVDGGVRGDQRGAVRAREIGSIRVGACWGIYVRTPG